MPGGKVDAGETVEETVVREVNEETGLAVEIVKKIGEYPESGTQDRVIYDFCSTCFLVRPIGGTIKRQESEVEDLRRFRLNELPERLAFEHAKIIQDYRNLEIS